MVNVMRYCLPSAKLGSNRNDHQIANGAGKRGRSSALNTIVVNHKRNDDEHDNQPKDPRHRSHRSSPHQRRIFRQHHAFRPNAFVCYRTFKSNFTLGRPATPHGPSHRDLFNRYPGAVSGKQRAISRILATGRGGGMRAGRPRYHWPYGPDRTPPLEYNPVGAGMDASAMPALSAHPCAPIGRPGFRKFKAISRLVLRELRLNSWPPKILPLLRARTPPFYLA